jgi:hypothetical protein
LGFEAVALLAGTEGFLSPRFAEASEIDGTLVLLPVEFN